MSKKVFVGYYQAVDKINGYWDIICPFLIFPTNKVNPIFFFFLKERDNYPFFFGKLR